MGVKILPMLVTRFKKLSYVVLWIIIFSTGIALGFALDEGGEIAGIENVRETSADYKFINPLLFVKVPENLVGSEYIPLRELSERYVADAVHEGKASDISIYYRNLNTSQWIVVNGEKSFYPASMLKVATLISVLRVAESDPGFLSRTVSLQGDDTFLK